MKKIILLLFAGLTLTCCSDDDSSSGGSSLSNSPEANATHDDSNYGVYKGVFAGSTGYAYVNINNSGTVSAKLVIDGVAYNYTTVETVTEGQDIEGLTFTNGSSSFDFNVSSMGTNPYINNISITGHPDASITLFKEYSDAQVKCYLGTFTGDDTGVFNLAITADGEITGLAKPADGSSIDLFGSLDGTSIYGTFAGGTFSGTLNGTSLSGQWQNELEESGTWTGVRIL